MIALMTLMVLMGTEERVRDLFAPAALLTLQLALIVLYVGSFTARSLTRGREVHAFEVLQGILAVLAGFGGGIAVISAADLAPVGFGLVALALAAASYLAAAIVDRRLTGRESFIFYTSLGLLFTVAAIPMLLHGTGLVLAFSLVALMMGWLGARRERATLSLHGAGYALAAAVTSGLLAMSLDAFTGASVDAGPITAGSWVALACAAAFCWFRVATHGRTLGRFSSVPKLVVLAVLVAGLGGVILTLTHRLLPGTAEDGPDAAVLAAFRTAILALAAVSLALLARWEKVREAGLLVYPLLALGGLKLALEDIPAGRPATLVASLALFGGALILAPRIARAGRQARQADPSN
jgi:hypothetical protein